MKLASIALYRCAEIKACENQCVSHSKIDAYDLMLRAGHEAFSLFRSQFPSFKTISIFCGSGNNGGDGYVFAKLAQENGYDVTVHQYKTIENLADTAQLAAMDALESGVDCLPLEEQIDPDTEIIIDALLGIGIEGEVRGTMAAAITQINESGLPIFALDIPSGLNPDTGAVANIAVKANLTATFIAPKPGFYTADGPDYCGQIYCCTLDLESFLSQQRVYAYSLSAEGKLAKRQKNSHKGNFGNLLIVGSGPGMPGAVQLAAKSALRSGVGSVTIACWPEYASNPLASLPESMIWGIEKSDELIPLLEKADFCVLGPGLGDSAWAESLFQQIITSQIPMLIDASALRLLSEEPQKDDNWILTPHPGEAAALLSCTSEKIQKDRYQAVADIQKQYGGVVVLKGSGSIIQSSEIDVAVCLQGNPGMATAGTGDVLSGIIAALATQGLPLADAAKRGVHLHALAGDLAAEVLTENCLVASDIIQFLPQAFKYYDTP